MITSIQIAVTFIFIIFKIYDIGIASDIPWWYLGIFHIPQVIQYFLMRLLRKIFLGVLKKDIIFFIKYKIFMYNTEVDLISTRLTLFDFTQTCLIVCKLLEYDFLSPTPMIVIVLPYFIIKMLINILIIFTSYMLYQKSK